MKTRIIFTFILLFIVFFLHSDKLSVAAENAQKRIRFQITTIAESPNERKILSQTTVEGLPGTDFNINLQTGNFKMQTRFLSDLVASDKLKIRANLDTRRFYGQSSANLPLYEEDSQKQVFEVGFDEMVVLLPFGRNGGDETLKIEIIPSLLETSIEDAKSPIKIIFNKQISSGEIQIEASKIPHRFMVEAILLENGQEVATGKSGCLLEEDREIVLQPKTGINSEIASQPFTAKVRVNKFSRNRPTDTIGVNFDVYRRNSPIDGEILPIIREGAGITLLGGDLTYRLENSYLQDGRNYDIKFKVSLAPGETNE